MRAEETFLKGCFVLTPKIFYDERGYFLETFNRSVFKSLTGVEVDFLQDNQSWSSKGVLRGLHFQKGEYAQAKLIRVLRGRILDVCVDLRVQSKTFGQYLSIILDDQEHKQVFVPRGFAHGFVVLSDSATVSYKCDNIYNKNSESGIIYNDKDLNIDWTISSEELILSEKDSNLPTLEDLDL